MKHVEIERKWLLDGFPELPVESHCHVEQGYLHFSGPTVRIRRRTGEAGEEFWLTIKGRGTLERAEVELPLDAAQYAALQGMLAAPTACKDFRVCRLPGGQALECSRVDAGEEGEFFYAEVEFDTPEEARAFVPPPFLGREVTEEPGWSMSEYCRRKGQREKREP